MNVPTTENPITKDTPRKPSVGLEPTAPYRGSRSRLKLPICRILPRCTTAGQARMASTAALGVQPAGHAGRGSGRAAPRFGRASPSASDAHSRRGRTAPSRTHTPKRPCDVSARPPPRPAGPPTSRSSRVLFFPARGRDDGVVVRVQLSRAGSELQARKVTFSKTGGAPCVIL